MGLQVRASSSFSTFLKTFAMIAVSSRANFPSRVNFPSRARVVTCRAYQRGALPSAARSGGPGSGKLGCSPEFFNAWTEFQMDRSDGEFSWGNRNSHWNFDHVIPQNSERRGIEDPYVVHSWANLRPYPSRKNSSKGCSRDPEDEAEHLIVVRDFLAKRVFLDEDCLVETRGGVLVPRATFEKEQRKRRR